MNDIDECNEAPEELVNNVLSQTCEVLEKFCNVLKESIEYFSKIFCNSEPWMYMQAWFEVCAKNPKSLHYMRRCKKSRIRKKHANYLTKEAFKIYKKRRKPIGKYI